MECSIGWIPTRDGFIVFKNRDRFKTEELANKLFIGKETVCFKDEKIPGAWAGFNKHCVAIVCAWGPLAEREGATEIMALTGAALSERSARKAVKRVIALGKKKKVSGSHNFVAVDARQAYSLELCGGEASVKKLFRAAAKTNCFTELTRFNEEAEKQGGDGALRVKRSKARLKKINSVLPRARTPRDVIKLLSSHSRNDLKSVCRHDATDYMRTVASAVIEVSPGRRRVKIFYVLNSPPCGKKFVEKNFAVGKKIEELKGV